MNIGVASNTCISMFPFDLKIISAFSLEKHPPKRHQQDDQKS